MVLTKDIINILNKPITYHERPGPAGSLYKYAKTEEIIQRLNEAFSYAWSSNVLEKEVVGDFIVLLIRLSITVDGAIIHKDAYGGSKVIKSRDTNVIMDLGNAYKSAFANALKGAAKQFGIGLSEWDEDDAVQQHQPNYDNRKNDYRTNVKSFTKSNTTKIKDNTKNDAGNVSSSTLVKIRSSADEKVDTNDLLERAKNFISNRKNADSELRNAEVFVPPKEKEVLFGKEKIENKEEKFNPFPSANADIPITDIQIAAIEKLCSFSNYEELSVISEARKDNVLRDSVKTFKELNQKEGASMIRFLMHKKTANA
jgi:hypothetical protein